MIPWHHGVLYLKSQRMLFWKVCPECGMSRHAQSWYVIRGKSMVDVENRSLFAQLEISTLPLKPPTIMFINQFFCQMIESTDWFKANFVGNHHVYAKNHGFFWIFPTANLFSEPIAPRHPFVQPMAMGCCEATSPTTWTMKCWWYHPRPPLERALNILKWWRLYLWGAPHLEGLYPQSYIYIYIYTVNYCTFCFVLLFSLSM